MAVDMGGVTLPDLQQFPDVKLSDVGGSALDFAKELNMGQDAVFGDYMKRQQAQPKSLELLDQQEAAAGIPEMKKVQGTLQSQVYSLEDSLRRVEPDISARSNNSIVTESQRRGMVGAAQKPLVENLGWIGQSLGRVSGAVQEAKSDVTRRVGYAMEDLKSELQPYKEKLQLMSEQNARSMTGFSQDQSTQLNLLVEKIKRGQQISDMEWGAAKDLALQNMSFEQAMKQQSAVLNKPENQVVDANGRRYLIDTKTGARVADLGSTKAPSTGGGGRSAAMAYLTPNTSTRNGAVYTPQTPTYFTPEKK